jgi:hypothetical protein
MQQLYPHQKRQTVPGTLHGTINQITKAMFHAFVNAYTANHDFYIVTEDTGFGDFDDLVLVTDQGRVTAIQYKHVKNVTENTRISVNDIISVSGNSKELMFYKYYQSLIKQRPGWENEPLLTFELTSNSPVGEYLGACIDPNTKQFKLEFFGDNLSFQALMHKIIVASILKHNQKLNTAIPNILEPYLNYLQHLLSNHQIGTNLLDKLFKVFKTVGKAQYNDQKKIAQIQAVIQQLRTGVRNELTDDEWKKLKKIFEGNVIPYSGITHLDVIRSSQHQESAKVTLFLSKFKLVYSEPDKDATVLAIKQKLLEVFKQGKGAAEVLYHSLFYDFMEWLASEKVTHITNTDIKNKFAVWQNQLIQLQRWIGISSAYQSSLVTTIDGQQFERSDLANKLSNFSESTKRALIVFGERGLGKSTALYQYITAKRKFDSDFLMLNINTILKSLTTENTENRCSFAFFHSCHMIIVENCEDAINYPENIIKAFSELLSKSSQNIKFIFSFRFQNFILKENIFGISSALVETFEVMKLDKQNVIKVFPFMFELSDLSRQATLYQKKQPNALLDTLICHPFYLRLLVIYYNKYKALSINFSSTDDFVKVILESLLNPSQLDVVRRLAYLISQQKETSSLLTNGNELQELVSHGIVVKEGSGYQFSHKLYEEWAIRVVIEMRLTPMVESNDEVHRIYEEVIRVLPLHQNEVYVYLGENNTLREYRRLQYTGNSPENFLSNNNVDFLKNAIANNAVSFLEKNTIILYVLVDSDPMGLLTQLLAMIECKVIHSLLRNNEKFKQDFYTVLIRGFCIAENMVVTVVCPGKNGHNIL